MRILPKSHVPTRLYSLSETKFSDLEFSEQVAGPTLTSMGLSFDSTGMDPV